MRLATQRIGDKGVVGFVTNNAFLDKPSTDGIRDCLPEEFSSVFIFNLRGYQRTSGDTSKREGGKIFGGGSRNGIAIVLLVKNPAKTGRATLYYHDIGDYLSREDKLKIIDNFVSVSGIAKSKRWTQLHPNAEHDWINQRDPAFQEFFVMATKDDPAAQVIFEKSSFGVVTNRDSWVYNASQKKLSSTVKALTEAYNAEAEKYAIAREGLMKNDWPTIEDVVNMDPKRISWTRSLKAAASRGKSINYLKESIVPAMYRPFSKLWLYCDKRLNEMPSLTGRLFPQAVLVNLAICTTGVGNRDEFSTLMTGVLPDMHMVDKSGASQCFPLYLYEPAAESGELDFARGDVIDGYRRREAITDAILTKFREAYGAKVNKEDIFYYIYGILHSPEYRTRFAADLKKMLPHPADPRGEGFQNFQRCRPEAGRMALEL